MAICVRTLICQFWLVFKLYFAYTSVCKLYYSYTTGSWELIGLLYPDTSDKVSYHTLMMYRMIKITIKPIELLYNRAYTGF
jgi:hypothetical protein